MNSRDVAILGFILGLLAVFFYVSTAVAQDAPLECDDNYGQCGTPLQSGGGGGGGGGSILINNTDLGDTYQYADDYDNDGLEDPYDNCPFVSNRDQADDDGDGIGTGCDNCPNAANILQGDLDGDSLGDLCDIDMDNDGFNNDVDVCPSRRDPLQRDMDLDELGDACDPDIDGDGKPNVGENADNCPLVYNPMQEEGAGGPDGEACDNDDDGDGIDNLVDNCPAIANEQDDIDDDKIGDLCDPDIDGDGLPNTLDLCPFMQNESNIDEDRDLIGDACDDRFCFVVEGDVENCLDPEMPFTVYTPSVLADTGETVRLHLFTNRVNSPIRYKWVLESSPGGSKANIANPVGAASLSTPYEYHYWDGAEADITVDAPGTYEIKLVAEQVWSDSLTGKSHAVAEFSAVIEVDGEGTGTAGCSTAPVGSGNSLPTLLFAMSLLGMLLVARRQS